jgi:N-acetylmuramic acid 6-phosphate etherase
MARMVTENVDLRVADLDAWPLTSAMVAMWGPARRGRGCRARDSCHHRCDKCRKPSARRSRTPDLCWRRHLGPDRRAGWSGADADFRLVPRAARFHHRRRGKRICRERRKARKTMSRMQSNRPMLHAVRVIAVSAIGTTPFTVAALHQVGVCQAITIGVANNPGAALLTSARYPVPVETGRELIAGSTRMKAGTAQKVVLNLISTGIMLRLGRVYRGMMVNMQTTNAKLRRRAEAMVCPDCQLQRSAGRLCPRSH